MTSWILDLETTIRYPVKGKGSSPYYKDNEIVYCGIKYINAIASRYTLDRIAPYYTNICLPNDGLCIGHNLAFDLSYIMCKCPGHIENRSFKIWDTQLVHYILTGQQEKYATLREVGEYYKLPITKGSLEEYWDNDIDTMDIPRQEIKSYLKQDLDLTHMIYIAQANDIASRHPSPMALIEAIMESRLATIQMEFNGMYINKNGLEFDEARLGLKLGGLKYELETYVENPGSDDQVSVYLFGGTTERDTQEPVMKDGVHVQYKTGPKKGQLKYKKGIELVSQPSTLYMSTVDALSMKFELATKKKGIFTVGEDVLREIQKLQPLLFIEKLLEYRKLKKDLSTYYAGLKKHIWEDNKIHCTFNHCATNTGRLSSSSPNGQNVSGYKEES